MTEPQATLHPRVVFEVCIASVEDAIAARDGGADRIELNAALAVGGLTPSLGLLREVRQAVALPLIVMIRPRAGGFCYSERDFVVMQRDAETALEQGADGLAFGMLRDDGSLDVARCRKLAALANGRDVVFHRAFDFLTDPGVALSRLAELGVRRIMTSGGCETALAGARHIARLVQWAAGKIEVLPAGKISAANVGALLKQTGCRQVHAALRIPRSDPYVRLSPGVEATPLECYEATCLQGVRDMRAAIEAWHKEQSVRQA